MAPFLLLNTWGFCTLGIPPTPCLRWLHETQGPFGLRHSALFRGFAGYAQGVQTGALTGNMKSSDGVALPGTAVTVTSSALQGERTTATDVNGVYLLANLPPGAYTVRISKPGLATLKRIATVPLGGTATVDATLALATISKSVVVQGAAPPPVTEIQISANLRSAEIKLLPMGRTPYLIAKLMPGVTTNTPNANQITISGGFAYDNVFLVDGVDVNDNLLGTSNNLFIEDAIGEVQVLSSGVSAEYGRFSGGVVTIITKSGDNSFSGSYRTNFTDPAWTMKTPVETVRRASKPSTFTELTAGGPAIKDHLWFFTAGRLENSSTRGTLPQTLAAYTKTNRSKRCEAKATGSLKSGHSLQGTYIDGRGIECRPQKNMIVSSAWSPIAGRRATVENHAIGVKHACGN